MAALYLLPNKLGRPPLPQSVAKGKGRFLWVEAEWGGVVRDGERVRPTLPVPWSPNQAWDSHMGRGFGPPGW